MTELKTLTIRTTEEFKEFLDKHLKNIGWYDEKKSRADYVTNALIDKLRQETDEPIPLPKAQWGIRKDARPDGWKSRIYPDRYQFVAVWNGNGWDVRHLHDWDGANQGFAPRTGLLDKPVRFEVTVYAPERWSLDDVDEALHDAMHEEGVYEYLFDREGDDG